jgi:hypothetical protein
MIYGVKRGPVAIVNAKDESRLCILSPKGKPTVQRCCTIV